MILLVWISENSIDIAGAMEDADNPQAALILEIKDHIAPHREAAQTRHQFVAAAAEARLVGQVLKLRIDQVNEGVSLVGVSAAMNTQISPRSALALGVRAIASTAQALRLESAWAPRRRRPSALMAFGFQASASPLASPSWMSRRNCWTCNALS